MIDEKKVVMHFCETKAYPQNVPFHAPEVYPEFQRNKFPLDTSNEMYQAVRNILYRCGLDMDNFNTPQWNPFAEFIKPGMTVFVKPNLVTHEHLQKKDIFSVITHASLLRPLLDYICKALDNRGRIVVGDCQLYSSDFEKAMAISQYDALLKWYTKQSAVQIEWFDLRINKAFRTYLFGRWGRKEIKQDPRGYRFVDLADKSCFKDIDPEKLRIAVASYKNMYKHHSQGKHEYCLPQSLLDSDVVISIPKLKTHRRTAITLALKNFMGIASLKDSLAHFQVGAFQDGGDQYIYRSLRKKTGTFLHDQIQTHPSVAVKFLCAVTKKLLWNSSKILPFRDDVYEAMWHGNDTVWRTLHDLNRAVMYADKDGTIRDSIQRKIFVLLDGIVGGAKDGPLAPDPVYAGVLLGGFNQAVIDAVGATLMGYDVAKIPLIMNAFQCSHPLALTQNSLQDIQITEGENEFTLQTLKSYKNLQFEPHPNWKGHVEFENG